MFYLMLASPFLSINAAILLTIFLLLLPDVHIETARMLLSKFTLTDAKILFIYFYSKIYHGFCTQPQIHFISSGQRSFTSLKCQRNVLCSRKEREVNSSVSVIKSYTYLATTEQLQVNILQGREKRRKRPSLSKDLASVTLLSQLHVLSILNITTAL